jgi:hypothetical protein
MATSTGKHPGQGGSTKWIQGKQSANKTVSQPKTRRMARRGQGK